jgi:hypothetical protein
MRVKTIVAKHWERDPHKDGDLVTKTKGRYRHVKWAPIYSDVTVDDTYVRLSLSTRSWCWGRHEEQPRRLYSRTRRYRLTWNKKTRRLFFTFKKKAFGGPRHVRDISYGRVPEEFSTFIYDVPYSVGSAWLEEVTGGHNDLPAYLAWDYNTFRGTVMYHIFPGLRHVPLVYARDEILDPWGDAIFSRKVGGLLRKATTEEETWAALWYGNAPPKWLRRALRRSERTDYSRLIIHTFMALESPDLVRRMVEAPNAVIPSKEEIQGIVRLVDLEMEREPVLKRARVRAVDKMLGSDGPYRTLNALIDVVRMEEKLKENGEALPRYRGNIKEYHDDLVIVVNDMATRALSTPIRYSRKEKALEWEEDGGTTLRLVESVAEVIELGRDMKNCLSAYQDAVAEKKAYILTMRKEGKVVVAVEVVRKGKAFHLTQASGPCNRSLGEEEKRTVAAWKEAVRIQAPTEGLVF